MTTEEYLTEMENAARGKLINPESPYYGIDGHKKFARECGYALNDFNEKDRQDILQSSYSAIYVIACSLRPQLDAAEWIDIMKSQIKA